MVDNASRVQSIELESYYPALLRHAERWTRLCRLGGSREAEDLVQQAVVALLAGASWPENVGLDQWLYLRIRQLATSQRRHEAKFPATGTSSLAFVSVSPVFEEREVVARLLAWVSAELDDEAREVFGFLIEEWAAQEIREKLSMSAQSYKSVRSRIGRTLTRMPSDLRQAVEELL